ncbi:MAG: hypothetical protein U1B77_01450, partial [Dehalococcoidales bacterium]|nr:hypothetical protein [Dehalococcoidales bacterium]
MAPIPGDIEIVPGSTFDPVLPGGQISITEPDDDGDGKPDRNVGFPLFIPGVAGHRAPTPPLDLVDDGGLPRHIVIGGTATKAIDPLSFAAEFETIVAKFLPEDGTPAEQSAMDFHATLRHDTFRPDGTGAAGAAGFEANGLPPVPGAPYAEPARTDEGEPIATNRIYRGATIQHDTILNKEGDHFPQSRTTVLWGDVEAILTGAKAPEPFVMRTNSHDVIDYYLTNLIPMRYMQDDFQVLTETDVVGQHMHLVKFDVLTADGAANGYNYEDGSFSPEEVRERIRTIKEPGGDAIDLPEGMTIDDLEPQPHPFFGATGPNEENWLGARTNIQRWYADPLVNNAGEERMMGNAFTHDHLSPSTVQQTGLYGTLLTEPNGSQWRHPETGDLHGGHDVAPRPVDQNDFSGTDGGPTSWRADIITAEDRGEGPTSNLDKESFREFYFEFADFQLAYREGRGGTTANPVPDFEGAINPPPVPEAISAADVSTYSVNYRNEPLGFRIFDPETGLQTLGPAGDLSLALSSNITRSNPRFNVQPAFYPPLTADVGPGDPFTPMPRAYVNDNVKVRIQVGATEEGHNFNIHGLKWLQEYASPNSGWRNSQMMGISEQFILDAVIPPDPQQTDVADYLYSANSASEGLWNGVWGILRSYARIRNDLLPLPGNPIGEDGLVINNLAEFTGLAPAGAPVREFDVTAVTAQDALPGGTLVYNSRTDGLGPLHDPTAIMYVRTQDLDADGRLKPGVPIEPLILRAAAGDRILLTLRNRLPETLPDLEGANLVPLLIPGFNADNITASSRIGLHPQLISYAIGSDDGSSVGRNADQTIGPGETGQYQWYAGDVKLIDGNLTATPIEFGAINLSSSDKIKHSNKGALGALIIEPQGSTWVEDTGSRASATVTKADGATFRDFVLVFQDDVNIRSGDLGLPNVGGEDDAEDSGQKAVNYRAEPFWFRLGIAPTTPDIAVIANDFTDSLSNSLTGGDPETPVFIATAGTTVRFRVLKPGGHNRSEGFTLHGHIWQRNPYINNSTEIGDNPLSQWISVQEGVGPTNHFDIVPVGGAGGGFGVLGDYLFRDMSPSHFNNGAWGILRVVRNISLDGLSSSTGLSVNQHNDVVGTVKLSSQDGNTTLTLDANTRLLGAGGSVVESLSGNQTPITPAPPPDNIILHSFELSPTGITFSPAVNIGMDYARESLPSDVAESSLRILLWDGTKLNALPSTVNAADQTVTAETTASGVFALMGQRPSSFDDDQGGGGGGASITTTDVALSGLTLDGALRLNSAGAVQNTVKLSNADGSLNINIPSGTTLKTAAGSPLNSLTIAVPDTLPAAPSGKTVVLALDLGPDGATFNPPLTLTLTYDPASLSAGTAEDNLVIAFWDGSEWVILESTVDTQADTISAQVAHFTMFSVMAEEATIPARVTAPAPAPTPIPETEPTIATEIQPDPAPEQSPVPVTPPTPLPPPPPQVEAPP